MFLGFQHPEEISGVSVLNFLRQAMAVRKGIPDLSVLEVRLQLMEWTKRLGMDDRFQERYLNEGFSGGEKKRNEILQMAMMDPEVAILDETDSGLDIDALRLVADGIAEVRIRASRPRHPADHALPAHPRPPHARRGARAPRRPHRRHRWPRAGAPHRGRGLRVVQGRGGSLMSTLDVARIKADFPILKRQVHGKRLVYLDSAATSQKPLAVLDAMDRYYREYNANVHRGVYTIAEEATAAFEAARAKVAGFVNAAHPHEIVYVRNATEAINLVAYSWARANLREGDPIVLTHMEHHANVVPWQILAAERGVEIRWIPLTADYRSTSRTSPRSSTAPSCSRSARCPTCSAPSTTSARSPTPRTRPARTCWSTPARRCPTSRSTCRHGTPTSWPSPPTRCAGPPASERCGHAASCSRRCRRSWAGAR